MSIRPRHLYEATELLVDPIEDAATIHVLTTGQLDFSFRLTRETLERLRFQIEAALSDQAPHVVQPKDI